MSIEIDIDRTEQVIMKVLEYDHTVLPEQDFVDLTKAYSEEYNYGQFPLNALFYATTLDFMSDTTNLFRKLSDPDMFERYSWIFEPQEVVEHDKTSVLKVCYEYIQPESYQGNAIREWYHNSLVLCNRYGGDIRNFFLENDNDAVKIIDALVVKPRFKGKTGLRRCGPNIASLYVQRVNQHGLYPLINTEMMIPPVDFHLGRIPIQTDGIILEKPEGSHNITYKILRPLYSQLCIKNGWRSEDVSNAMWYIGSQLCSTKKHEECPLNELCVRLISKKVYDSTGKFDPTDIGRFK